MKTIKHGLILENALNNLQSCPCQHSKNRAVKLVTGIEVEGFGHHAEFRLWTDSTTSHFIVSSITVMRT